MTIIETLILPIICAALVYAIRYIAWPENVPKFIERIRWLIAIIIMIIIVVGGAFIENDMRITPVAAGLVGFFTASSLKN